MLTSKLTLMALTWAMALLASIFLRIIGIIHPDPIFVNHFFVWLLVFGPSIFLFVYFLLKRCFSIDLAN